MTARHPVAEQVMAPAGVAPPQQGDPDGRCLETLLLVVVARAAAAGGGRTERDLEHSRERATGPLARRLQIEQLVSQLLEHRCLLVVIACLRRASTVPVGTPAGKMARRDMPRR